MLIGCALQLLSQSIEACDDFFERSRSDHRKKKDVRISSIIGYPTSCTTFVPLPSPMNISVNVVYAGIIERIKQSFDQAQKVPIGFSRRQNDADEIHSEAQINEKVGVSN
jgi:hypothetical protein